MRNSRGNLLFLAHPRERRERERERKERKEIRRGTEARVRNEVEVKRVTLFVARLLPRGEPSRRKFNILTIEFPRTEINFSLFLSLSSGSILKIDGVVFKSSREHASFKCLFIRVFDLAGIPLCPNPDLTCCHLSDVFLEIFLLIL